VVEAVRDRADKAQDAPALLLLIADSLMASTASPLLKPRQMLGKYRIERRLAAGGFATVYQGLDTIEGIRVALKVPHATVLTESVLRDFRKEARLTAQLEHPHILPLKNASFIEGRFVIVSPLGAKTLGERMRSRISFVQSLDMSEQMLDAVAYAHRNRIIHCDIKPENVIVFPGNRLRLTDFGIAKVAMRTIQARGTGTVGYMAPEQAAGKPSQRSDVFSLGLVLWRLFAGHLPEWPYQWPPAGIDKVRDKAHPDLLAFLRKAIEVFPRDRFSDGTQMLTAFRRLKSRATSFYQRRRRRTQVVAPAPRSKRRTGIRGRT
jgi:serine/threonine-protein kinase